MHSDARCRDERAAMQFGRFRPDTTLLSSEPYATVRRWRARHMSVIPPTPTDCRCTDRFKPRCKPASTTRYWTSSSIQPPQRRPATPTGCTTKSACCDNSPGLSARLAANGPDEFLSHRNDGVRVRPSHRPGRPGHPSLRMPTDSRMTAYRSWNPDLPQTRRYLRVLASSAAVMMGNCWTRYCSSSSVRSAVCEEAAEFAVE